MPFEGLIYARCGVALAPTFLGWGAGLLVGDHPLVGHFGLLSESPFGVPDRLVGAPDASGGLGPRGGAGGQLELTLLFLDQRGALVGVILAAGQHAPNQDRELAGGRDDRLAVTPPSAGPFIKRPQRTGLLSTPP